MTFDLGAPPCIPDLLPVRPVRGEPAGVYVPVGPATHGPAIVYRWHPRESGEAGATEDQSDAARLVHIGLWGEE
ncbi:MAG: hypothetical protein ACLQBX_04015 [Candidatus Limnocylindrales bacterium]